MATKSGSRKQKKKYPSSANQKLAKKHSSRNGKEINTSRHVTGRGISQVPFAIVQQPKQTIASQKK